MKAGSGSLPIFDKPIRKHPILPGCQHRSSLHRSTESSRGHASVLLIPLKPLRSLWSWDLQCAVGNWDDATITLALRFVRNVFLDAGRLCVSTFDLSSRRVFSRVDVEHAGWHSHRDCDPRSIAEDRVSPGSAAATTCMHRVRRDCWRSILAFGLWVVSGNAGPTKLQQAWAPDCSGGHRGGSGPGGRRGCICCQSPIDR